MMKKSRYSENQIIRILKEVEAGDLSPKKTPSLKERFPLELIQRRSQYETQKVHRRTDHRHLERT